MTLPSVRFQSSSFHSISSRRGVAAVTWLTIAAGGVYLYIFEPGKFGYFPFCPFRALTGLNCPGCGTTRSLHQLLHGNLTDAFKLNPLLVIALPFFFWALARYTNSAITGGPPRSVNLRPQYVWPVVGLVICFWIFRNTPFYPFPS
jgi:hypothetical protein